MYPKTRFREYTADWHVVKVKDVLKKVKNPVIVVSDEVYREIGIRSHGKGIFYKEPILGEDLGNKSVFWVEPNTLVLNIVFAWERAVARTTENEVGMIASHRFPMYKPVEGVLDIEFITRLFVTPKGKYLLELASPGGAGRNKTLGQKEFEELQLAIPSLEEQQKIGSFFSILDQRIERQREKIEQLELYRKGMLQKILSQEIRFKDESGRYFPDWDEVKLGDVAEFIDYGLNAAAKDYDGENKYIRITDIDDRHHQYIDEGRVSPSGDLPDDYLVKVGDILLARTGASTGKSYLYKLQDGKMYFAGFLIRVRVKASIDYRFVYYQTLTDSYKRWIKVMSMRSGQPGINATEYESFTFRLPCKDEQLKISSFFLLIDEKILKNQDKLNQLLQLKQGLTDQMF